MTLQQRAQAFLKRPIPADLDYVPDSMSERLIRTVAADGEVDLDPELAELLEICVMESQGAAESGSADRRAYFAESSEILQAILDEANA